MVSIRSCHDNFVREINGVTTDKWTVDGPDWRSLSNVPNDNALVPTSGYDGVRVVLVELYARYSTGVTVDSLTTAFEIDDLLPCLFIVDVHDGLLASAAELRAINVIIAAKELATFFIDAMQSFA